MPEQPQLLFVYNADGGLFNTLTDAAHKIISPATYQCHLCKLTHGWFTERQRWTRFLDRLDMTCHFLHRDAFLARYPAMHIDLPAVLRLTTGQPECWVTAAQLNACRSLEELIDLLAAKATE